MKKGIIFITACTSTALLGMVITVVGSQTNPGDQTLILTGTALTALGVTILSTGTLVALYTD